MHKTWFNIIALCALTIKAQNNTWSSYAPGLLFALRTKQIDQTTAGIVYQTKDTMRHDAPQHDEITYEWKEHNGNDYGIQVVNDKKAGWKFEMTFVVREDGKIVIRLWNAKK